MDTLKAIKERRAVKNFDPTHKFSDLEIRTLIEHLRLAPTAFNLQNSRFVFVTDHELRKKLREASWDQSQVTDASLLVILCGDKKCWQKNLERCYVNAPKAVQEFMLPAVEAYYKGKEQVQRDEVMRSCGIAAQTLMLTAKAMGYDSCPMDGFDFEAVAKLIHLPKDHLISMFVAIGKGIKAPYERMGFLPENEIIFKDSFVA